MSLLSPRWSCWACGLALVSGCLAPVREHVDQAVCDAAAHPVDVRPLPAVDPSMPRPADEKRDLPPRASQPDGLVRPASAQEPAADDSRASLVERLRIPSGLPGANAPAIPDLPRYNKENNRPREEAVRRLYPPLPDLGPEIPAAPGPQGRPLTLADLQALALANSPLVRQAASRVEQAEGAARQSGAYPNPSVGYEADTAGTGNTAGYQGVFFDQVIKTAGKLKLSQAAALMDLENARLNFRKVQADLATQVRTNYFQVLVAREGVRTSRELVTLADQVYGIQVEQLRVGYVASYEPMQLRVLALQARGSLVTARTSYQANWKQLAATLGLPGLTLTELDGRIDMPLPVYRYDAVLARVLDNHTDVRQAYNNVQRARYNLRLAEVTPVPDVTLHLAVQKDYTTPPFSIVHTIQLGVPVPIWDRNQGGIRQAQGTLLENIEEPHRVRDDLVIRLTDAFQRYESNRVLLEYYRTQILPDQVRAYQSVFRRHNLDTDVTFGDVVTAQQTLATAVTTYVTTLGATWQSVVDIAGLLQTNDLFQLGGEPVPTACVAPLPDLHAPAALPCDHPCSPLSDPALKAPDPLWAPPAGPSGELLNLPAKGGPTAGEASPQRTSEESTRPVSLRRSMRVTPPAPGPAD